MSEWQDISTAPKDGSSVLCFIPLGGASGRIGHRVLVLRWDTDDGDDGDAEWLTDVFPFLPFEPTHWMPLPAKPTTGE